MMRFLLLLLTLVLIQASTACAQSGLRESLERLDKNENGEIDPDEVTPLARPYLERIAKSRRLSLARPNSIEKFQEAARIYFALQNGVVDERIAPNLDSPLKGFGSDPDVPVVPEFGLADIKFPYLDEDLDEADQTLRRYDRNDDGHIDRNEAKRAKWTHRDPFEEDANDDNRLSRMELAQRYARRRQLKDVSGELVQRAVRVGVGIQPSVREKESAKRSSDWRRGGTRNYLTMTIMGRFDNNRNGRLDADETARLGIPKGRIDSDRNGELSGEELNAYLTEMQDQAGDGSDVIPGWFYERDANRDGQVAMAEFAAEWSEQKVNEFASFDLNHDGVLTESEVVRSKALVGGSYTNTKVETLPPHKTVISEIEVSEEYLIGDLNVQLSITHTHDMALDAYLTGPDGQRVELFTAVGGHDDHFDQTTFDDQSRFPITKARPPFKGTFMPEGLLKRQPGLSQFNGTSVKGVWQLVISGTRSDRFGMLHGWSLQITPQRDMVAGVSPTPVHDGPQHSGGDRRNSVERGKDRRNESNADRGVTANIKERVRESENWQRQIEEHLAGDISDKVRESLQRKLTTIEMYKEHLRNGGTRENFDWSGAKERNKKGKDKVKIKKLK